MKKDRLRKQSNRHKLQRIGYLWLIFTATLNEGLIMSNYINLYKELFSFDPLGLSERVAQTPENPKTTVFSILVMWNRRIEQRRQLAQLSDALLEDVGMTRAEAERESKRPFWMS